MYCSLPVICGAIMSWWTYTKFSCGGKSWLLEVQRAMTFNIPSPMNAWYVSIKVQMLFWAATSKRIENNGLQKLSRLGTWEKGNGKASNWRRWSQEHQKIEWVCQKGCKILTEPLGTSNPWPWEGQKPSSAVGITGLPEKSRAAKKTGVVQKHKWWKLPLSSSIQGLAWLIHGLYSHLWNSDHFSWALLICV